MIGDGESGEGIYMMRQMRDTVRQTASKPDSFN